MLYSIIPPILIILSLIGIILFLMKKAPKVAALAEEDFSGQDIFKDEYEKSGFFKKISLKIKNIHWEEIKHWMLAVLEKITSKSRVIFLKLESRFGSYSASIRNKRKEKAEKAMNVKNEDEIIKKLRDFKIEKKRRTEIGSETVIRESFNLPPAEEEKIIKPIISEKITTPSVKTEIKDKLEELLIERIATNPKDVEAYERLGEYYMEIKSYGDAKECYKQVIKLNPANRSAKYKMKRLENFLSK